MTKRFDSNDAPINLESQSSPRDLLHLGKGKDKVYYLALTSKCKFKYYSCLVVLFTVSLRSCVFVVLFRERVRSVNFLSLEK